MKSYPAQFTTSTFQQVFTAGARLLAVVGAQVVLLLPSHHPLPAYEKKLLPQLKRYNMTRPSDRNHNQDAQSLNMNDYWTPAPITLALSEHHPEPR